MQQRAVAGASLNRVAKGVPQVERRAHAALALVSGNHLSLQKGVCVVFVSVAGSVRGACLVVLCTPASRQPPQPGGRVDCQKLSRLQL